MASPSVARSNPPPTPSPSPSFFVIGERIAAGTHVVKPFGIPRNPAWTGHGLCAGQSGCTEPSDDDSIRITFTVPDGWAMAEDVAVTKPSASTEAPSGMSLHFLRGGWLYSDPCLKVDDVGPPDIEVGPTADDFADALAAQSHSSTRRRRSTSRSAGIPGSTSTFSCRRTSPSALGYVPWAPAFYAQGPNHRWHIWSLDVDGVRVVIQSGDFPGTLPEDLAEMHAIIESIRIEP